MKRKYSFLLVFMAGVGVGYFVNSVISNGNRQYTTHEDKIIKTGPGDQETVTFDEIANSGNNLKVSAIPTHGTETTENRNRDFVDAKNLDQDSDKMVPSRENQINHSGLIAENVDSIDKMQSFLKATVPSDVFSLLKDRRPLDQETALSINGHFSGQILFFEGKRPRDSQWKIEVFIEGEFNNGNFTGRDEIKMFDSTGKMISSSQSSSSSHLKNYFLGPDESLFIQVKPGDYIQIFNFTQLGRWSGHYFKNTDIGQYEQMGVVHLMKR